MKKTLRELVRESKLAVVSLVLFVLVYIGLMMMNLGRINAFCQTYHDAINRPVYADQEIYFVYGDVFLEWTRRPDLDGMSEENARAYFDELLPEYREEYTAIFISHGMIYTFVAYLFLQYFLAKRYAEDAKGYYRSAVLGSLSAWVVYMAVIAAALAAQGFAGGLQSPKLMLILLSQLLVMLSASAVYAWLMRRVRFKKTMSLLLIMLSFVGFYGGILSEGVLMEPKQVESFDYLYDVDERFRKPEYEDISRYNAQTHQLEIGEDAYDPQMVPNEDYVGGAARAALIAWEIVNPLANIDRLGYDRAAETEVRVVFMYILKSVLLLGLVGYSFRREKRKAN